MFIIHHMLVRNFELKGSQLKTVKLISPQLQDDCWNLDLPELRCFVMDQHIPPEDKFAKALIQCPKLEECFVNKFWNEKTFPALYLPNCKLFTFRRGDCTSRLMLYLPRVQELVLDGCYSLKQLMFLEAGHKEHAAFNLKAGVKQSKFHFKCVNANIGTK